MSDPSRLVLGALMTAAGIVLAEILTGNSEPEEIRDRTQRLLRGGNNGR